MSLRVGEVIAVNGVRVSLRIDEESSKETLFYEGERLKGVSIREYLAIQRGFREIICIVEGEYLDESRFERTDTKLEYIRKVDVRPIGYFEAEVFHQGIKYLPMIKDPAYLLSEGRIERIFERPGTDESFRVGRMLKEDIEVSLPWKRLFNSHIGIFGNTGSGKSNTLAKLYTVLFTKKLATINGKSRFVLLDFNGEYMGDQLAPSEHKIVYALNTQGPPNVQAGAQQASFPLSPKEFWDLETLSLLFQATTNTQRPFLNRLIEGRKRYEANTGSLTAYARKKFRDAFCAGEPKAASLDLLRSISRLLQHMELSNLMGQVSWHSGQRKFFMSGIYFDPDGANYDQFLAPTVSTLATDGLDAFDQLLLRANLQLIGDLVNGYVQFEHIQPLIKRIESSLSGLRKVLRIESEATSQRLLTVISLRRCNNEIKKVLPLLMAKHYYNSHKDSVSTPPKSTIHLIVDEAHNILSQQSSRESESWKDYRLEQFEEIIKEGRKFGVFVTIASQRPADISPTIVSQIHNFFLHRLINDRDLFLVENTITTLDSLSRSLIPTLSQGSCVVTGTAFELPMVLQIDLLEKSKQPDSNDVDLEDLWSDA